MFYFTPRLVADLFAIDMARVYRRLGRLRRQGLIEEVEHGKFLLLGLEPERVLANPLFVASQLVTPGYVSYWSALHFYGFTEQVPRDVFVATTKKKRPVRFHGTTIRFVTLKPRKLFGYCREPVDGLPVLIADEAKAIIDSLDQSRYAGGIPEVAKALRRALEGGGAAAPDVATLVDYANRVGDLSLGSRLGHLLGALGKTVDPCSPETDGGLIRASGPIKLDPTGPATGPVDRRWQVIVNVDAADLFPAGVG